MDTLTPDRRRGSVFVARSIGPSADATDLAAHTTAAERRLEAV